MDSQGLALKIEVLTPLHITDGAWDDLTPLEYVVDTDGKLHVIDFSIFADALTPQEQEAFAAATASDSISVLCSFVQSTWRRETSRFADAVIWSANAGDITGLNHVLMEKPESRFFLKPFIRSGGKLLLPGSAIKGAIRTALIAWFFGDSPLYKSQRSDSALFESHVMQYREKRGRKWGKAMTTADPFKALKVIDAVFLQSSSIVKKIFHLKSANTFKEYAAADEGILDLAECIEPGAIFQSNIVLAARFFDFKKHVGRSFTLGNVINACKAFSSKVLAHESANFFNAFDSKNPGADITALYEQFMGINRQQDCFLLRIGRYGGRNSNSFNLYNSKGQEPQSRSIVLHQGLLRPLGWIKVSLDRHNALSKDCP